MNSVQQFIEWLKGRKTYIIVASSILAAVAAWLNGTMDVQQMLEAVLAALGVGTLRAGIAKGPTQGGDQ